MPFHSWKIECCPCVLRLKREMGEMGVHCEKEGYSLITAAHSKRLQADALVALCSHPAFPHPKHLVLVLTFRCSPTQSQQRQVLG